MKKPYEDVTLLEFQKKYSTEEQCAERLFRLRWPDGFVCPRCGHREYFNLPRRRLFQCKNNACGYQASVTAGTVMHKTRTPLVKWFWAIYLVSTDKRGISALALLKRLQVSYVTAWSMLHKIRKAMRDRDSNYQLAGIIEMDDSYFGGTKGGDKRGRGTRKTTVLIEASTYEEAMTYARMNVVDAVKSKHVLETINKDIQPNQVIKTDGFKAYTVVAGSGHGHHKEVVKGKKAHTVLKWVHIVSSNAKSFLKGTYHGTGERHLQKYLDEFCYRLNRRFWEGQLFDRLVTACASSSVIPYSELVK